MNVEWVFAVRIHNSLLAIHMLNRIVAAQECDAKVAEENPKAGNKKKIIENQIASSLQRQISSSSLQ